MASKPQLGFGSQTEGMLSLETAVANRERDIAQLK
jgi:hypothetical protein